MSDMMDMLRRENERLKGELAAERKQSEKLLAGHIATEATLVAFIAAERKKVAKMREALEWIESAQYNSQYTNGQARCAMGQEARVALAETGGGDE